MIIIITPKSFLVNSNCSITCKWCFPVTRIINSTVQKFFIIKIAIFCEKICFICYSCTYFFLFTFLLTFSLKWSKIKKINFFYFIMIMTSNFTFIIIHWFWGKYKCGFPLLLTDLTKWMYLIVIKTRNIFIWAKSNCLTFFIIHTILFTLF